MGREYIIYSDESDDRGQFYSHFYGGALVESKDLASAVETLNSRKDALFFKGEVKWSKVTEQYLERYLSLIDTFFDLVAAGRIKVRIMFHQNANQAEGLRQEHRRDAYHLLYYQFIKNAFGLTFAQHSEEVVRLRLYFDHLQGTREQRSRFKAFLLRLGRQPDFRQRGIFVDRDQIAEVDSHDHVILQCVDVVMGAMQFRLNNKHKEKPPGERIRGKKTRAKEKLYKRILQRIQEIYPGFNIGIRTGMRNGALSRWQDPYRHWSFVPRNSSWDSSRTKK